MKPLAKKRRAAPAMAELADDPQVLRALLGVYGKIDLAGQTAELAERAADWAGARGVVALSLDDRPDRLVQALSPEAEGTEEGDERPGLRVAELNGGLDRDGELEREGWPEFLPEACRPAERTDWSWSLGLAGNNGETVGLLVLMLDAPPASEAAARVRALVQGARGALTNGVAVRAIRDLVFKDDTADCYNRRYFDEFFAAELARARRFRAPLSLIFFDMDNLKQVNSIHGHAMGSRTLLEVSRRVRAKIRRFDKLFRFGGDEFCIVLPETEWHGALEVAERVRESIAGRPMLVEETGEGVKMTASFGISSFPLHARTAEELIHRADWAMQRIKSGTKNSIAIAEIAKPA